MRESRNHAGKPRTAPRRLWPFESAHEYAEPSTGHVEPRKSGYLQSCVIASTTGAIYQAMARREFETHADLTIDPLTWIITSCGNRCLNPQHMLVHQPVRIAYPAGVCVYCGLPAGTKDHLIPKTWTGEARRHRVAVVPACAECNSAIGDRHGFGVHERRGVAHDHLRRKHRRVLAAPDWTQADLDELGPGLRSSVEAAQGRKHAARARLAWPEDPFYDIRAWQQSGIEDPVAIGACASPVPAAMAA